MFGYSKDELIGLHVKNLVDKKYHLFALERCTQRLLGKNAPQTYEIEFKTKQNQTIPVEISSTRIEYGGRPAALVILRETTERRRLEEERLKLERMVSMGELATNVAHDLRNPLTAIRNASFYIAAVACPRRESKECKTIREMINVIEQETVFASNIIDDLLDFAVQKPLERTKHNVNQLLEDSIKANRISGNIKVEKKFAEKAIAAVDEKQLKRVFLNLIKNAEQAMPNGGKLVIETSETEDHVEITFADTGTGISEENLSKVFQPLFTTKAKGIGLGLAISKEIVERHGGAINATSEVGHGTTFTIELPKIGENKK